MKDAEISAAVDAAIADGRIHASHRDNWVLAFARDPAKASARLAARATGEYDQARVGQLFGRTQEEQLRDPNSALATQMRGLADQAGRQHTGSNQAFATAMTTYLDELQRPADPAPQRAQPQPAASGAMPSGPADLFPGSGALPAVCASGIDPAALVSVPWQARPLIARTVSPVRARQLIARYAGATAEELAADRDVLPDVKAYEQRTARAAWEAAHPGLEISPDGITRPKAQ